MSDFKQEISSEICLTLLCSSTLEEKLLDLLLMTQSVRLFTSGKLAVHGVAEMRNPAEQVLGRVTMTQVQVLLGRADLHNIINTLVKQFKGTGIRYWVTDVIHMGEIQ